MSDRACRVALGLVVATLLLAVWTVRLPQFWGDGATYYTAARSLAEDFDLEYEARDVARVRREFAMGPQGIFLKRASGGFGLSLQRVPPEKPRIYFAKAFLYPVVAAPFVAVLGTRGLLVLNVIALGVALFAAYAELRRRTSAPAALAGSLVLVMATIAPVYVLWPTPELFGLGLIAGGLWAWRAGHPVGSALLLGLATYMKPYNLFLALPLGIEPLLVGAPWTAGLRRGFPESMRRGLVLAGTVITLFGLNKIVTGEANYQGGERKTFYGSFPLERDAGGRDVTFGNSGFWMTTDSLGPLVEGQDDALVSRRTGPARAPEEIRLSFVRNLGYFWVGRFGGALAYFLPAVLALLAFTVGPRDRPGGLALAALLVSYLFYITQIPDNWYGGGGTLGNRYFLNLLPLAAFLIPRRGLWPVALLGLLGSALFLGPVWSAPLHHSLLPGDHAMTRPFRALPPELTMLNDLGIFTELWRKKQPVGDTEGDAHRNWPADPKAYYLYFSDNGMWGREDVAGRQGFRLRGAQDAEVIVRALEPVRRLTVSVAGGPAGDRVTITLAGRAQTLELGPGQEGQAVFEPGPGFPYYDTFLHVVRFRSERAGPLPGSMPPRSAGGFVTLALEVDRRPRS